MQTHVTYFDKINKRAKNISVQTREKFKNMKKKER